MFLWGVYIDCLLGKLFLHLSHFYVQDFPNLLIIGSSADYYSHYYSTCQGIITHIICFISVFICSACTILQMLISFIFKHVFKLLFGYLPKRELFRYHHFYVQDFTSLPIFLNFFFYVSQVLLLSLYDKNGLSFSLCRDY